MQACSHSLPLRFNLLEMYGNGYGNYGGMQREMASDMWIQRNIPGGLNGKSRLISFLLSAVHPSILGPAGSQLDNMLGGNPNPTYGQMYGGYGQGSGQGYGQGYGYQQSQYYGRSMGGW